jgi:3-oxoadipate enol-lactonase
VTNFLLLHGTPLTPAIWSGVIPLLAERGGVAAPAVVPGSGPAAGAQRALARRLAVPGVVDVPPPWHVVGHSFGGQVALELAAQRPDLVASLVLLCTRDTPYPPFAAVAAGLSRGTVDVDGSLRRWFSPAELDANGGVVRYARDTLGTADRGRWGKALSAIAVFDVSATIPTITCPVTVISASHDRVSDPSTMADMASRMATAELTVLEDAWHMSTFTDPVGLAHLIDRHTRRAAAQIPTRGPTPPHVA